jgi:hypothetical protein
VCVCVLVPSSYTDSHGVLLLSFPQSARGTWERQTGDPPVAEEEL